MYLVAATALVSGAQLTGVLPGLGDISAPALARGEWWNVLFYCFNLRMGPIGLLFTVYMMFLFGTSLEGALGHGRYTGFVLLTITAVTVGTLLLPIAVPPYYLELAISVGCAFAFPNMEIMLFFVLPLRLKWVAVMIIGFALFESVSASLAYRSAWPMLSLVVGMSGVIVFFVVDYLRGMTRQTVSRVRVRGLSPDEAARHMCTVCHTTELDNPTMDFRFCVECNDHEYCTAHIANHEHIR